MQTEPITLKQALAWMDLIVADRGEDFVYEGIRNDFGDAAECVYVRDGKADCMAGRVFAKAGVPVKELAAAEGRGASSLMYPARREAVYGEFVKVATDEVVFAIAEMQRAQDGGSPYGRVAALVHRDYDRKVK